MIAQIRSYSLLIALPSIGAKTPYELHGMEKKFLYNSQVPYYSHDTPSLLASKFGGENTVTGNSYGLKVLQQVQSMKINMNQGLKPHSIEHLWNVMMMPGLGYYASENFQY